MGRRVRGFFRCHCEHPRLSRVLNCRRKGGGVIVRRMAKKGIKVKDLAAELGVTSRQLIDRCRSAGVPAQNSITRFPPHVERLVRSWFAEQSHS